MEGFDEALDRAVWSLSDQRLKSDRDIAEKRRNKPRNIETLFRDHFREQEKVDTYHMVQLDEDVGIEDIDMDGKCPLHNLNTETQFCHSFSSIAASRARSVPNDSGVGGRFATSAFSTSVHFRHC
jgi:hypothetical protein